MGTPIEKLVVIEKIVKIVPNRYEAVRVMAKEARRINSLIIRGAPADSDYKPTTAAMERFCDNRVKFEYVKETPDTGDFFEEE
jgi:DNA-directed RNA polymerase subunit K/omega